MFVQVIEGKVGDSELMRRQMDGWMAELKPGAIGYLGSTGGLTPDGRSVTIARFESAEAAAANGNRPEQTAWWNETAKAYDGEPTFHDCTEVDTVLGGGSDDAGFVQVIEGRAKDAADMRRRLPELEAQLRETRPDILGMTVGWHGDNGFTQVIYFRSEAEAREQEKAMSSEQQAEVRDIFDGEPTFFDLPDPQLD